MPVVTPCMGGRGNARRWEATAWGPLSIPILHMAHVSCSEQNHPSWTQPPPATSPLLNKSSNNRGLKSLYFHISQPSHWKANQYWSQPGNRFLFSNSHGCLPSTPLQCLGWRSVAKGLQILQWHLLCSEAAVASHRLFLGSPKIPLPPGEHWSVSYGEAGGWQRGQTRYYQLFELEGSFLSKWKQKLSISIYAILFLLENKKPHQGKLLQFSAKIFKFWVIKFWAKNIPFSFFPWKRIFFSPTQIYKENLQQPCQPIALMKKQAQIQNDAQNTLQ